MFKFKLKSLYPSLTGINLSTSSLLKYLIFFFPPFRLYYNNWLMQQQILNIGTGPRQHVSHSTSTLLSLRISWKHTAELAGTELQNLGAYACRQRFSSYLITMSAVSQERKVFSVHGGLGKGWGEWLHYRREMGEGKNLCTQQEKCCCNRVPLTWHHLEALFQNKVISLLTHFDSIFQLKIFRFHIIKYLISRYWSYL